MIQKVQAFIYRREAAEAELLVFWSDSSASYQLVRGTVEEGESPEFAVLREINEESGLSDLIVEHKLGEKTLRIRSGPRREGPFEDQLHHAFLIRMHSKSQDTWTHRASGGMAEDGLIFRFSWTPIDNALEQFLFDDFVPFLPELFSALGQSSADQMPLR